MADVNVADLGEVRAMVDAGTPRGVQVDDSADWDDEGVGLDLDVARNWDGSRGWESIKLCARRLTLGSIRNAYDMVDSFGFSIGGRAFLRIVLSIDPALYPPYTIIFVVAISLPVFNSTLPDPSISDDSPATL